MISIGNDIVALSAINVERTKDLKFYSRILCESEQALYHQPENAGISFENYVWLLWSVKESVYKYRQRVEPSLIFSPRKIVIQSLEQIDDNIDLLPQTAKTGQFTLYRSIIRSGSQVFHAVSVITMEYISSVVGDAPGFESTNWDIFKYDSSKHADQSEAVRVFAISGLTNTISGQNLSIDKNVSGCPIVLENDKETGIPLSLAHHGQYVSYAFKLQY